MRQSLLLILATGGIASASFVLRATRGPNEFHPEIPRRAHLAPTTAGPQDLTLHPIVHPDEEDAGPQRIISMAPSITQTCFALGLGNRLVGRTQYCIHPPNAKNIRSVGALVDPNLELIAGLKPELLLVTTSSAGQLTDKLVTLGLPVEQVPDSNLEDVFSALEIVGRLTGRLKTATAAIQFLRADIQRLADATPKRTPPPTVLIVTGPLPIPPSSVWVAGPGSYLDELIQLAGCQNALADMGKPWGEAALETIARANPNYFLESRDTVTARTTHQLYTTWSTLGEIRAIHEGKIRSIAAPDLLIPSPRVNITLYELIRLLSS